MSTSDRGAARDASQQSEDHDSPRRASHEAEQSRKRAKRSRYISIACNECKRRKIKCNGQTPCRRCGHLDLQCVYTPNSVHNFKETQEFQQMTSQINTLQQAVESLTANIGHIRPNDGIALVPPSPASIQSYDRGSMYSPPVTTAAVTRPAVLPIDSAFDTSRNNVEPNLPCISDVRHIEPHKDPIWTISKEEAWRLTNVWRDTIHPTLPILNLERTFHHINMLYVFLRGAARSDPALNELPGEYSITDADTLKLKLVLATSMAIEGASDGDMGCKLFTSVVTVSEQLLFKPVSLENLELLVLSAICAFHKDDEHLAWRLIGLTARMLFEYGINNNYTFEALLPKQTDAFRATMIIWVIFVLDRRWSLLNNLPSALKEDDIDHFKPDNAFFFRLIELIEISWKILPKPNTKFNPHSTQSTELLRQIDSEALKWYSNLPQSIRYNPNVSMGANMSVFINTTPIHLYLRTNQTRIAMAHPILLSQAILISQLDFAKIIVNVARETIQTIKSLTSIRHYLNQCRVINYFLMSAVAAIFLARMQAPDHFEACFRGEFRLALEMMCAEKPNSFIGKRLLRTLKVLNQVGHILRVSSGSGPGVIPVANSSSTQLPTEMMSPLHQKPPSFMINDCVEPNDRFDDLTNGLMNMYDTPSQGQDHDLAKYDALTKIFRDLF